MSPLYSASFYQKKEARHPTKPKPKPKPKSPYSIAPIPPYRPQAATLTKKRKVSLEKTPSPIGSGTQLSRGSFRSSKNEPIQSSDTPLPAESLNAAGTPKGSSKKSNFKHGLNKKIKSVRNFNKLTDKVLSPFMKKKETKGDTVSKGIPLSKDTSDTVINSKVPSPARPPNSSEESPSGIFDDDTAPISNHDSASLSSHSDASNHSEQDELNNDIDSCLMDDSLSTGNHSLNTTNADTPNDRSSNDSIQSLTAPAFTAPAPDTIDQEHEIVKDKGTDNVKKRSCLCRCCARIISLIKILLNGIVSKLKTCCGRATPPPSNSNNKEDEVSLSEHSLSNSMADHNGDSTSEKLITPTVKVMNVNTPQGASRSDKENNTPFQPLATIPPYKNGSTSRSREVADASSTTSSATTNTILLLTSPTIKLPEQVPESTSQAAGATESAKPTTIEKTTNEDPFVKAVNSLTEFFLLFKELHTQIKSISAIPKIKNQLKYAENTIKQHLEKMKNFADPLEQGTNELFSSLTRDNKKDITTKLFTQAISSSEINKKGLLFLLNAFVNITISKQKKMIPISSTVDINTAISKLLNLNRATAMTAKIVLSSFPHFIFTMGCSYSIIIRILSDVISQELKKSTTEYLSPEQIEKADEFRKSFAELKNKIQRQLKIT